MAHQTGRLPSELLEYYKAAGPEMLWMDLRLIARGVEISATKRHDVSTAEGTYNAMKEKMGDYEQRKERQVQGYA